ncbi:MAG: hypothetical protein HY879_23350 [Deltaproteobacteria bacterium]|nr:hypothetical protein [Deltaproteobacteria bacterium]
MNSREQNEELSYNKEGISPVETGDFVAILSAFSEQIKFYGEFLRDNDRKRDQFVRFYLSILLATVGFGLLSLNLEKGSGDNLISLSQRLFVIFPVLLSVSLIVGVLTFNVIIKFRNLHTYYVKMINRNRGYLVNIVANKLPDMGSQMADAWDEHIHDDFPKFLQTKGLEHSIARFHAIINAFVFGTIGFLTSFSTISELSVSGKFISGIVKFLTWTIVIFIVHMLWQRTSLKEQDDNYKPKLVRNQIY